jgi:hypothetical protein
MTIETTDANASAARTAEGGLRAQIEEAVAREGAAAGAGAAAEPISPELAGGLVDLLEAVDLATEWLECEDPKRTGTTADTIEEALAPQIAPPPAASTEPQHALAASPSVEPVEEMSVAPRRLRRRRRFLWLVVCLAFLAAAVLFLPTNWLRTAHIHLVRKEAHTGVVGSGLSQPTQRAHRTPADTHGTVTTAAQPRLTALRAHAFGWARVPTARYYRVRFFRDGREVFEATPVQARLVLPAHWRFRGHEFSLDAGRYRWVVQAVFGAPSAEHDGRTIVSADLVAVAP